MTQQLLPLSLPAQPRPRRRRPGRSALPGWRFAVEYATTHGRRVTASYARTGNGLADLLDMYGVWENMCYRVVASRDQGRTWRPATADQLRAMQADARQPKGSL
jgi:hypothetical protein